MCKVEIEHPSQEAAQSLLNFGFREWRGGVLVADEREQDGRLTQTLIPMRENTTPPYVGL
jgi:hypothetical protein